MADEKVRKEIEEKLKALGAKKLDEAKIEAAIKEGKALKGDKDMPD